MSKRTTKHSPGVPGDSGPTPADRPALPLAPEPRITQVGHLAVGPLVVTFITRRWREDRPRRCLLCPAGTCSVYKGVCTVAVAAHVAPEKAKWFDASGLAFDGPGLPLRVVGTEGGGS